MTAQPTPTSGRLHLADQHVHPEDGPYAPGTYPLSWFRAYADVASGRSVCRIGLVEHSYRFKEADGLLEGPWAKERCQYTLNQYDVHRAQVEGAELPFRFGLEVDHVPGKAREIGQFLALRSWDFLLGSVHWLGDFPIDRSPDDWADRSPDDIWEAYVQATEDLCQTGLYDVLTHPDLPKIWGHRPRLSLDPWFDRIVQAVSHANMALEINTRGLRRPIQEVYPDLALVRRAHAAGVPISLGSDAHRPEDVGRDLDLAVDLARAAGYDRSVQFSNRRREELPFSAVLRTDSM